MAAPVLFLDIDGVLLAGRHWRQEKRERLPADTIALLNSICYQTSALIVVSSVWRFDLKLRRRLNEAGFTGQFHCDWRSPDFSRQPLRMVRPAPSPGRGHEIADWLSRNDHGRYAIVDDDDDMLPGQMPFFVKTKFEDGLGAREAEALVAILLGKG